ncbi:MAG: hypothetical protein ABSF60_10480 [Verrucomicrobiota bacterium]|jgi:hypothetical protein
MKTIIPATTIAILAEGILYGAFSLFGKIALTSSNESSNLFGIVVWLFHMPGLFLAQLLFSSSYMAGTACVLVTGALQFFLLAWFALARYEKWQKNNPA